MINKYELNLKVVNKNTTERKEVVRIEYAYTVMDACAQAIMHTVSEVGNVEVTILRIGPPLEDILKL